MWRMETNIRSPPEQIKLKPFEDDDIDIAIDACGVCGSDVHTITGGWGDAPLPLCVGHEVIGRAVKVGKNVKDVKVGQRVGVGAQIGADLTCGNCKASQENYCPVCLYLQSRGVILTRSRTQLIPTVHLTQMELFLREVMLPTSGPINTSPSPSPRTSQMQSPHP